MIAVPGLSVEYGSMTLLEREELIFELEAKAERERQAMKS